MKKTFEPVTDTIKHTSGKLTKFMMLISKEKNLALENLNKKLLERLNDRSLSASHLLSSLSIFTKCEHNRHFKLVKDPQSNNVNDL